MTTTKHEYIVIHPLDDTREAKVDVGALGPMKMTRAVHLSLTMLRGYLIVMMALLGYRLLGLAGLLRH